MMQFVTALASLVALFHFVCMAAFLTRGCARGMREVVTLCATASMYVFVASLGDDLAHYIRALSLWMCCSVVFFVFVWHSGCRVTQRGSK